MRTFIHGLIFGTISACGGDLGPGPQDAAPTETAQEATQQPLGCVFDDASVSCDPQNNLGWFPAGWRGVPDGGVNCTQLPCEPGWGCEDRKTGAHGVCR